MPVAILGAGGTAGNQSSKQSHYLMQTLTRITALEDRLEEKQQGNQLKRLLQSCEQEMMTACSASSGGYNEKWSD